MAKVDVSSGGVEMLLREGDSKGHPPACNLALSPWAVGSLH